jgi:hypothetical protein
VIRLIQVLNKIFSTNPEEIEKTGAIIQELVRITTNDNVNDIKKKGGIPLLINIMREHFEYEAIVEITMRLLDKISYLSDITKEIQAENLLSIELIVWLMYNYSDNMDIIGAGARILTKIIPNNQTGGVYSKTKRSRRSKRSKRSRRSKRIHIKKKMNTHRKKCKR